MTATNPPPQRRLNRRAAPGPLDRRHGFSWTNLAIVVALLAGLGLMIYPSGAAWVSQYNQSNIIFDQTQATSEQAKSALSEQLKAAATYNSALRASATLEKNSNLAIGTGHNDGALDYWRLLTASPTGTMARLRIPSIDLDLPVYHGTSESTLQKGVGHLQGTSLPVGGEGTRAVLTGHRGLANATMFTHLDRVKKNDLISIDVLGQILTYRVVEIVIVDPDDTEEIRPDPNRDLLTLVTCTPLGINTQRILITGERITPTPSDEIDAMMQRPDVPGFPWWIVILCAGYGLILAWYGQTFFTRRRSGQPRRRRTYLPPRRSRTPRSERTSSQRRPRLTAGVLQVIRKLSHRATGAIGNPQRARFAHKPARRATFPRRTEL